MAINTTPKEKPTGDGNPTAGAINDLNGPVTYWAERWGLVRHLPTLHDAALFLAQIGGRL